MQEAPDRHGGSEAMSNCVDLTPRKEVPMNTRVRGRLCVDVGVTSNNQGMNLRHQGLWRMTPRGTGSPPEMHGSGVT